MVYLPCEDICIPQSYLVLLHSFSWSRSFVNCRITLCYSCIQLIYQIIKRSILFLHSKRHFFISSITECYERDFFYINHSIRIDQQITFNCMKKGCLDVLPQREIISGDSHLDSQMDPDASRVLAFQNNSSYQAQDRCGNRTNIKQCENFNKNPSDSALFNTLYEQMNSLLISDKISSIKKQVMKSLKEINGNDKKRFLLLAKLRQLITASNGNKNLLSKISNSSKTYIRIDQVMESFKKNEREIFSLNALQNEAIKDLSHDQANKSNHYSNSDIDLLKQAVTDWLYIHNNYAEATPTIMKENSFQSFAGPAMPSMKRQSGQKGLKYFQNFIASFQSQSYCYLYARTREIITFMEQKLSEWGLYMASYKQLFKKYLDIFKAKIENMSQWRLVYGSLQPFNNKLEKKLEYKGNKNNVRLEFTMADLLFQHFIQQLQSRNTRSSIYYVRNPKNDQKIPLADFIAVTKEFFEIPEWRNIFGIIEQRLVAKNPSKQEIQSMENRLKILENPSPSVVSNKEHLCCSKFFYIKENINYSHTKSKIVLAGDITQRTKLLPNVQKQICGLLNSQGGVILFDCQAISTKVVPRGSEMIEKEMGEIKESLEGCLDKIHPRPVIDKNIFVTFVPVAEPENGEPKFISGTYVTRITVKPHLGSITYMILKENQVAEIYHRKQSLFDEGLQLFTGKKIHTFMSKKFKQYKDQYSNLTPEEQQVLIPTVCDLDHKCEQPERGAVLKQKEKPKKLSIETLRQKYRYVSVLVAKQQHHETIKRNLAKKGIICEIALPFKESKLKGAAQTAVLYHNNPFDQLLNIVSYNKEYEFGGRYLLIILITPYLRLTDRTRKNLMSEQDFKSLTTWLKNQYPNQQMSLWEFTNEKKQTEYYIKTKQPQSLLFLYIVLNQFMQKSAFKSPKINDKLPASERLKKLRQLLPTNSC